MNMFPTNDSHITSFKTSSFIDTISVYMYLTLTLTNILFILPPSIFVLYLGHQRWRQQRSVSTAAIISNSDFFTYNLAAIELIGLFGNAIGCFSNFAELLGMIGFMTWAFAWNGQMFFPLMTCVDRYLAVVHPVTYLVLKQARGVRIRNIIAGTIWVLGFGGMGFMYFMENSQYTLVPAACNMVVCLIVMIFCSLSVLFVLIRPRPGKVGIDRLQVEKSKQRAFYTILIIMGVLTLRFGGCLVSYVINTSSTLSNSVKSVMNLSSLWLSLPSSLVLPLLFLHRAGKLPGCKHNTESG